MKLHLSTLLGIVYLLFTGIMQSYADTTSPSTLLWYSQPAKCWLEAMPLGNSRMGAMEYGGTEWEELQLNEETFWSGSPHNNDSKTSASKLAEVRQLIFQGQEEKAAEIINKDFVVGPHGMRYLSLGSMKLHFEGHDKATNYYRDLNLETATATTSYEVEGVKFSRTTFASIPDGVIIMRINADKANAINFSLGYTSEMEYKVGVKKNTLTATIKNEDKKVSLPDSLLSAS